MSGDVFGDDFLDALDSADPVTDDGGDTVVSEVDQHEADAERHSAGSDGADLLDVDADDQEDNDDADDQDEHPVACRFCHAGFETVDRAEAHTCPDRRAFDDTSDQVQRPSVLVPGTHELSLLTSFDGHGVAAYWDLRRTFDEDPVDVADAVDGFAFEGDCWYIDPEKTSAWRDGIAIPEDQREHCPPIDEDADTFFEFQFSVVADDPVGERKATFTVRPSFPDARKPNGDRVGGFPADAPEGVRVEINSANVHPWRVFELLGRLLEELDVDPAYVDVENLHPWSRVTQLGRYYRVLRELSEEHPVSMGGLLERISRVAPCAGGKGAHFWDDEDVTGHYEAIAMDCEGWEKLLPGSSTAKLLQSYHPFRVRSEDNVDDYLRDPKLELKFATSRHLDDGLPWDGADPIPVVAEDAYDLADLLDEFDETLANCIKWAGLPTHADQTVHSGDEYWTPTDEPRDIDFVTDPVERVADAEADVVEQQVARLDTSEGTRAVLADLLDGQDGKHWSQIRESAGVSKSTVYRAAKAFPDILRVENGHFSLEDRTTRETLRGALSVFEDVTDWVRGRVSSIGDAVDTSLEDTPLLSWARRHGVDVDRGRDGLTLRIEGRRPSWYDLWNLARDAVDAAVATGSNTALEFAQTATLVYQDAEGQQVRDDSFVRYDSTQGRIVVDGVSHRTLH
jgi:hypothetical protein